MWWKNFKSHDTLTPQIPWVTKTEFLLTIPIQYFTRWVMRIKKNVQTNIARTVWQTVSRSADEILRVGGLKKNLIGWKSQVYGTISYMICKKNHTILMGIESKHSSSHCFNKLLQDHNLHPQVGDSVYTFSHFFFPFNEFF